MAISKFNFRYITTIKYLLLAVLSFMYSSSYADETQDQYYDNLGSLCGTTFEGKMTFPVEGQDSFAGKLLVAKFESCTEDEIRVPFLVGEDASRTWIFSKIENGGLQLKHDHRHSDDTPDEVTMYGGIANSEGSVLAQSFEADAYTAELIPAAATNVWNVSLSADQAVLTYHLERNAAPRFTAVLKRIP